jgi:hypothetical protein
MAVKMVRCRKRNGLRMELPMMRSHTVNPAPTAQPKPGEEFSAIIYDRLRNNMPPHANSPAWNRYDIQRPFFRPIFAFFACDTNVGPDSSNHFFFSGTGYHKSGG